MAPFRWTHCSFLVNLSCERIPFQKGFFYHWQIHQPLEPFDATLTSCSASKVTNFGLFNYRNPTPKNILGVHWDMAKQGEILQYLAINTTENSTTLWNYRQRECAFWTEYLPSVIGYITPTYPPTTEVLFYFYTHLKFNNTVLKLTSC
jgi:hypothetical protein